MSMYKLAQKPRRRLPRRLWIIAVVFIVVVASATIGVQRWYYLNLTPVSTSTGQKYITIVSGATVQTIAQQLKAAGLIRSSQAFEWYVSIHNDRMKLQAGTYRFVFNQSTPTIANDIVNGVVATNLVTILPGQRIDQVRQLFLSSGFTSLAVDVAFQASQYQGGYPALADNPASATLEGFLYPDSFQKISSTDPRQIVAESLTEMQTHLTTDIRNGFAAQGLSVYQGVTLSSIVEQEVSTQTDRDQAAQVFVKRLQLGMPLGSDVTANYGAIMAGMSPSLTYNSPYNTLLHTGFPPGPIGTISDSSLEAVAHPAKTDWLYFVTGDDGVTHFAKTLEQHNANVSQYCHKLCSGAS